MLYTQLHSLYGCLMRKAGRGHEWSPPHQRGGGRSSGGGLGGERKESSLPDPSLGTLEPLARGGNTNPDGACDLGKGKGRPRRSSVELTGSTRNR